MPRFRPSTPEARPARADPGKRSLRSRECPTLGVGGPGRRVHPSQAAKVLCNSLVHGAEFDSNSRPADPAPGIAAVPLADQSAAGPGRRRGGRQGPQTIGCPLQGLVLVGCLDEIFFHGRPVLVGVEPASMVWFLGKKVGTCGARSGPSNCGPWDALRHVIADAAGPCKRASPSSRGTAATRSTSPGFDPRRLPHQE